MVLKERSNVSLRPGLIGVPEEGADGSGGDDVGSQVTGGDPVMPGLTGVTETKNSADDWEGGGLPVIGGGDHLVNTKNNTTVN